MEEGYLKFRAHWTVRPPYPAARLAELIRWRDYYYQMGFIGAYDQQIGFGNISQRIAPDPGFYISGSATGLLPQLTASHFARVTHFSAASNELWCEGPIIASSESMSHAAIYQELPEVHAIVHAHHRQLWERLLHRVPTTAADAPYGSPEMVDSIIELIRHTDLAEQRVFAMAGHEEGLFFFGRNFAEVAQVVGGV
jgi:ribulose-5-phosphate 4-epimerase/fuculose-1-phosphate aldolase